MIHFTGFFKNIVTDFMQTAEPNTIFNLAADLVNYTDKHVFLTGKAGTGKTTFLKFIRDNTHKNTAIVAPTGVAAINAGGTTLHSLLQLPFGLFIPDGYRPTHLETRDEIHDKFSLVRRLRIKGKKKKVLEALELLIIDEISMVRVDLLDMVDTVLRAVRKRPQVPFGGVQVLYIGDMFQLPPVLKDGDRELLLSYYKSPFFFDARVIQQAPPQYVELTHVYRQSDETFISLLNEVRNNRLTEDGLALLKSRYMPGFNPPKTDNYITLATHNFMADQINARELNALSTRVFEFEASVKEDFPDTAYPVEKVLRLKLGAQVMFLKNDTETPRRFFNGKIGIITDIDKEIIRVKCAGEDEPILVPQETWKNIRYTYEPNSRAVKEEELGSFTQYPLRLAWAITIHKSQGLTFEKAIIDAGRAFEAGQVYVALSRCTCLDGMVLLSPVTQGIVMTHERIAQFGRRDRPMNHLEEVARSSKREYLRMQILQAFQYVSLVQNIIQLQQIFGGFKDMFNASAGDWLHTFYILSEELHQSSKACMPQLSMLLEKAGDFEEDLALQGFLQENSPLLLSLLQEKVLPHWRRLPGMQSGHSRKSADAFFEVLEETGDLLKQRALQLSRLKDGFNVDVFFGRKSVFQPVPATPLAPSNTDAGRKQLTNYKKAQDIPGMDDLPVEFKLVQLLKELTESIAEEDEVPVYMIANKSTIKELATYLPMQLVDLQLIRGFGSIKTERFGARYIQLISEYCQAKNLSTLIHEKKQILEAAAKEKINSPRKSTPGATTQFSAELWKQGKSIEEIALERGFARSTIEGHLAQALETGMIDWDERLLPEERRQKIEESIDPTWEEITLTSIRERLGEEFGYGEIKLVLAFRKRMQQQVS